MTIEFFFFFRILSILTHKHGRGEKVLTKEFVRPNRPKHIIARFIVPI